MDDPPRDLWRGDRHERQRLDRAATVEVAALPRPAPLPPTRTRPTTTVGKHRQFESHRIPPLPGGDIAAVIAYAVAQQGKPYIRAADGPAGFDCSGLVVAAYARIGISLPHQTGALAERGRAVSRADVRAGDLVFTNSGHVGIYLGDGKMIHAPKPGDRVRIADMDRFSFARRVVG